MVAKPSVAWEKEDRKEARNWDAAAGPGQLCQHYYH